MKRSPLLWLRKKLHHAFRCKKYLSQMIWFLMGVYIINRHYLAAWRYIISLLVSKNRVCLMVTHDPQPTTIRQTLKNIVLVWSAPQDIFFIKRREIPYLRADMQYPLCFASYSSVKKRFKGLFIVSPQWGGVFYGYRLKFRLFYGYWLFFFSYG